MHTPVIRVTDFTSQVDSAQIAIECANIEFSYDNENGTTFDMKELIDDLNKPLDLDTIEIAGKGNKIFKVDVLHDTGAAANFIGTRLVTKWLECDFIGKYWVKPLPTSIQVIFANNETESIDSFLPLQIRANGVQLKIALMISRSTAKIIIGRKTSKELGLGQEKRSIPPKIEINSIKLAAVPQAKSRIEEIPQEDGTVKILVRNEVLENTLVTTSHVPPGKSSKNRELIVEKLAAYMERMDQIERTTLEETVLMDRVVIVDKLAKENQRLPWEPMCENLTDRYRMTLNAKSSNDLVLVVPDSGPAYLTQRNKTRDAKKSLKAHQFQTSPYQSFTEVPAKCMAFNAKVDLSQSFQSVLIDEKLRRLYATRVWSSAEHKEIIYRWKTLVQGCEYSSMSFKEVVNYLLEKLRANNSIAEMIAKEDLYFFYLQDDINIAASSKESCQIGMETLLNLLKHYNFRVNIKKLVTPTETLNFCGFNIGPGGVVPCPTRTPITALFADEAWSQFKKGGEKLKWFRSIAGTFQYFRNFMHSDQFRRLRVFYDLIQKINQLGPNSISKEEESEAQEALYELVNFVTNGLPKLTLARFNIGDVISIVIVDSNHDAWSAVLVRMIRQVTDPGEGIHQLPEFVKLVEKIKDEVPTVEVPEFFSIVPTRICGKVWSKSADLNRGSTVLERLSQFEAVSEMRPLLLGPVIVVNDNHNTVWEIKDPQTDLTGAAVTQYIIYKQEVTEHIWMDRESLPKIPDMIARIIAKQSQQVKKEQLEIACKCISTVECNAVRNLDRAESNRDVRLAILEGLESDEDTTIHGVKLQNIWKYLNDPREDCPKNICNMATKFIINDGLLKLMPRTSDKEKDPDKQRLYIPQSLTDGILLNNPTPTPIRNALIFLAHTHYRTGHLGRDETYKTLDNRYYWPNMGSDVAKFCASCKVCMQTKDAERRLAGELSSTTAKEAELFKSFMVDFTGPFVNGMYVLGIIDFYSRYLELIPCERMDVETYLKAIFDNIILKHGVPARIHGDAGRTFASNAAKLLGQELGINLTHGTTYNPRVQGLIESSFKGVKQSIASCLADNPNVPFDRLIQIAASIHNHHPHRATGISPYQVITGQSPTKLSDIPAYEVSRLHQRSLIVEEQREHYRLIHEVARKTYTELMIEEYNKKAKKYKFNPGDIVYRHKPNTFGDPTVSGPHRIIKKDGINTWTITTASDYDGQDSCHDRVAENQLRKLTPAEHLRTGLPTAN